MPPIQIPKAKILSLMNWFERKAGDDFTLSRIMLAWFILKDFVEHYEEPEKEEGK